MHTEIERKFLVLNNDFIKESHKKYQIIQGFLNSHKKRTVRIRITSDKAFLTIKGKSNKSGTIRFEWEKEIPIKEAKKLLKLCEKVIIKKTRYLVGQGSNLFEIDVFKGKNKGLIIAEIELKEEQQAFKRPSWLGKEVTGDLKYYNSVLSKFSFNKW
ncbi:MAG: CYTH domain-containing protein [Flavobacteriaceae bacterium]|nr:CYTH domain-containing protein [Flavobacteriaceae bacterium]